VARSMRNAATRRAAPNVEQSLHLLVELVVCEEDSFVEPGLALDTLNLGHAGLRNECRSGTSAIVSSTFRTGLAAPRRATPRLRRPPRKRTPLHQSRPSQRAEARFVLDNKSRPIEILCADRRVKRRRSSFLVGANSLRPRA
jgi:hypothetical protein